MAAIQQLLSVHLVYIAAAPLNYTQAKFVARANNTLLDSTCFFIYLLLSDSHRPPPLRRSFCPLLYFSFNNAYFYTPASQLFHLQPADEEKPVSNFTRLCLKLKDYYLLLFFFNDKLIVYSHINWVSTWTYSDDVLWACGCAYYLKRLCFPRNWMQSSLAFAVLYEYIPTNAHLIDALIAKLRSDSLEHWVPSSAKGVIFFLRQMSYCWQNIICLKRSFLKQLCYLISYLSSSVKWMF